MDISLPIRSVIPSLDGPVYAVLAATSAPLTLGAVHDRCGLGSKNGVRGVLLRMVDAGLVHVVPGGYVLNREHLAAPAIETLSQLHGELTNRIRRTIDDWDGDVIFAGYFGSIARRDGDDHSDIDVLVVSDESGLEDLVADLSAKIQRWTGNDAHVVGISRKELGRLRTANEPIIESWKRELVPISNDQNALETTV